MTVVGLKRPRHWCSVLVASVALAVDDPAWFFVQAGRKLPAPVRNRIGLAAVSAGGDSAVAAWGHLLLEEHSAARALLPTDRSGSLAGALALNAGAMPTGRLARNRARWSWVTGDLDDARAAAPELSRRQRERLLGDLALLEPGPRPLPPVTRSWEVGATPRVLHVLNNSLPWTRSGYTLRTHDILTAQVAAGIPVVGVTKPGYPAAQGRLHSAPSDTVDGIAYHRSMPLPLRPGEANRVDQWTLDIADVARQHRATHLHSTTPYGTGLAAQAAARALGLPWVHEVRGQLERTWASARLHAGDPDPYGTTRYAAWRAKEAEVAAAADQVITLSTPMLEDLVARGVERDRITVVPNGIDTALLDLPSDPAGVREEDGLPRADLWVGAVSSVLHYEGFDTFIEALALVREAGLDVRGVIVGEGPAWPELRRLADELELDERLLLPGSVERSEAHRWLSRFDAVAVPRHRHEVTSLVPPLKLVEAMGAARPVLVSDLPALTEVAEHERSGLVVPPGSAHLLASAILQLAEDPGLRDRLGKQAREDARGRTWPELAGTYQAVYRELSRV